MFSPSLFIRQQMELPFDHSTKSLAEILREAATSANSHPRHPSKLGPLLGIEIREISRAATRYDKLAANFLAMVSPRCGCGCALMSLRPGFAQVAGRGELLRLTTTFRFVMPGLWSRATTS
jgi:hypothetical protein